MGPGSITTMKRQLELETLEERGHSLRLVLLYNVVEGMVTALPTTDFVTTAKPKRNTKAKVYKDCEMTNIIERRLIKNSKGLKVLDCNTAHYAFILRGSNRPLEATARKRRVRRFRRGIQDHPVGIQTIKPAVSLTVDASLFGMLRVPETETSVD